MAILLSLTSPAAKGQMVTYNGSISPTTLGGSLTTTLPEFNSSLGTLTGVQVTLDLTATPYAQVINFSDSPITFDSGSYTSETFGPSTPEGNWTVSYFSDSWQLTAPTVTTGDISGSGQSVSPFQILTFIGGTSASADLTSASGLDFSDYTGAGTLVFGITGPGYFSGGGAFYNGGNGLGGGGADLTGTASVTYDYVAPVPEPTTIAFVATGLMAATLLIRRRRI